MESPANMPTKELSPDTNEAINDSKLISLIDESNGWMGLEEKASGVAEKLETQDPPLTAPSSISGGKQVRPLRPILKKRHPMPSLLVYDSEEESGQEEELPPRKKMRTGPKDNEEASCAAVAAGGGDAVPARSSGPEQVLIPLNQPFMNRERRKRIQEISRIPRSEHPPLPELPKFMKDYNKRMAARRMKRRRRKQLQPMAAEEYKDESGSEPLTRTRRNTALRVSPFRWTAYNEKVVMGPYIPPKLRACRNDFAAIRSPHTAHVSKKPALETILEETILEGKASMIPVKPREEGGTARCCSAPPAPLKVQSEKKSVLEGITKTRSKSAPAILGSDIGQEDDATFESTSPAKNAYNDGSKAVLHSTKLEPLHVTEKRISENWEAITKSFEIDTKLKDNQESLDQIDEDSEMKALESTDVTASAKDAAVGSLENTLEEAPKKADISISSSAAAFTDNSTMLYLDSVSHSENPNISGEWTEDHSGMGYKHSLNKTPTKKFSSESPTCTVAPLSAIFRFGGYSITDLSNAEKCVLPVSVSKSMPKAVKKPAKDVVLEAIGRPSLQAFALRDKTTFHQTEHEQREGPPSPLEIRSSAFTDPWHAAKSGSSLSQFSDHSSAEKTRQDHQQKRPEQPQTTYSEGNISTKEKSPVSTNGSSGAAGRLVIHSQKSPEFRSEMRSNIVPTSDERTSQHFLNKRLTDKTNIAKQTVAPVKVDYKYMETDSLLNLKENQQLGKNEVNGKETTKGQGKVSRNLSKTRWGPPLEPVESKAHWDPLIKHVRGLAELQESK